MVLLERDGDPGEQDLAPLAENVNVVSSGLDPVELELADLDFADLEPNELLAGVTELGMEPLGVADEETEVEEEEEEEEEEENDFEFEFSSVGDEDTADIEIDLDE